MSGLPSVADLQRKNLEEQKGNSPASATPPAPDKVALPPPKSEEKKERKKEIFPENNTDFKKESSLERKKERKKESLSQLSIKIPETLDRRLERYCFEEDEKKQEVMSEALDAYLTGKGF